MKDANLRIVFTAEDRKMARKNIPNFRQSYIVDARDIILELDYAEGKLISSAQDFIINKELERKLSQAIINKKSKQTVYFHYVLSNVLIKNVKQFFQKHKIRPTYIVFDPPRADENGKMVCKYKRIHHLFDEVLD